MSKHEMHVEFTCRRCGKTETLIFLEPVNVDLIRQSCRRCGKTETLIFLEPVNVDLIRQYVTPPDWGFANGGCVCKECLEVRGKWLN